MDSKESPNCSITYGIEIFLTILESRTSNWYNFKLIFIPVEIISFYLRKNPRD
jgi:hypothetical protein